MTTTDKARHEVPSEFAKRSGVLGWRNVTECVGCGALAAREDAHPASPCYYCGGEVEDKVGRWVRTRSDLFCFLFGERGYWALHEKHRPFQLAFTLTDTSK